MVGQSLLDSPVSPMNRYWRMIIPIGTDTQCCRVEVETAVRVRRSQPFWRESEPELQSIEVCRPWPRSRVPDCVLSIEDNFDRTDIHLPEISKYRQFFTKGTQNSRFHQGLFCESFRNIRECFGTLRYYSVACMIPTDGFLARNIGQNFKQPWRQ